jgi:hypothetical protein
VARPLHGQVFAPSFLLCFPLFLLLHAMFVASVRPISARVILVLETCRHDVLSACRPLLLQQMGLQQMQHFFRHASTSTVALGTHGTVQEGPTSQPMLDEPPWKPLPCVPCPLS